MQNSHRHGHVEILLPVGCELTYLTQDGTFIAPDRHISVIWGQIPHRVSEIEGNGYIVIANLPLAELLTWSLPETFLSQLFAGQLVTSSATDTLDEAQFARWLSDSESGNGTLLNVARMELQLRLRRQTVSGWKTRKVHLDASHIGTDRVSVHVQNMVRFLAEKYTSDIHISDVAGAAKISKGYAMRSFQNSIGMSINAYLTQLRLHHAKAGLMDSKEKVINIALDSGFGSLSRFYEVFTAEMGMTPHKFRALSSGKPIRGTGG